jgi:multidrug resistance efflux pump
MTDAVAVSKMTDAALQQANQAYHKQVSDQITRVTGELRRMEDLLSAGLVDRRVLTEFRHAVDRVRSTGWQVERWLSGDESSLSVMLVEDRIRLATRMVAQLTSEAAIVDKDFTGLRALKDAITKLEHVLQNL